MDDPVAPFEGRRTGRRIAVAHQRRNLATKRLLVEPECVLALAVEEKVGVEVHDGLHYVCC
jgi:hypothetical protein